MFPAHAAPSGGVPKIGEFEGFGAECEDSGGWGRRASWAAFRASYRLFLHVFSGYVQRPTGFRALSLTWLPLQGELGAGRTSQHRPQDGGKRAFGNLGACGLEERQSVSSAKEISDLLRASDAKRAFDV